MKNNDNDNKYMIKWYEMTCVYIYIYEIGLETGYQMAVRCHILSHPKY